MNGVHDMGGMHGMGPIGYEKNPPVFHEPWEGRTWALVRAMAPWGRGRWRSTRYELERLPPADYLRMPYYERWLAVLVKRLLSSNLVTPSELASGKADAGAPRPTLPPPAARLPGGQASAARMNVAVKSRFKAGQRVRARNIHPAGHTRLPRYVRGRHGTVLRDHGVWALQDTSVDGEPIGARPQHVYTVQFAARELWGDSASARDAVFVDLWEDYLERP
jgi:nitrile hydratase subunit beta